VGERSGWWAGFRAECLVWRLVGLWVDGWVKGWESRVVGFGWSGPQLEPTIPPATNSSDGACLLSASLKGHSRSSGGQRSLFMTVTTVRACGVCRQVMSLVLVLDTPRDVAKLLADVKFAGNSRKSRSRCSRPMAFLDQTIVRRTDVANRILAVFMLIAFAAPAVAGVETWAVTEANKTHTVTTIGSLDITNDGSTSIVVKVLDAKGKEVSIKTIAANDSGQVTVASGNTAYVVHNGGDSSGCVQVQ
jgi:hypothetical protein